MDRNTILVELILAGFFAVACVRTMVPDASDGKLGFGSLVRLPGRLERLRRSRWQWFSMVALLLVLRLQTGTPLILELTIALQFIAFMALPTRVEAKGATVRK
ncbi:MAG TPA: hypothetical protein VMB02_01085 [Candidatus Aquilonibacter sp.]|nr:hypothetical protein [Candidatus Aquilonibacter sp.]